MGQTIAKPQPHGEHIPRSPRARASCELKHVKRLIKTDRLAPCWTPLNEGQVGWHSIIAGPLAATALPLPTLNANACGLNSHRLPLLQGHECPVCMENYVKLNHTGCCDQEICESNAPDACACAKLFILLSAG